MPQSMNRRVRLDMRLAAPVSKDSLRGNIFDLSAETRKRALRMNEGQDSQLDLQTRILDKHKKERFIEDKRKIDKLDTCVKNLFVYKRVLQNYHYDKLFIVNNKSRECSKVTKSAKKRINAETKLLQSGFSVNTLKPQMAILSKELDPKFIRLNKLHEEFKHSKAHSDITLSREGTFSAVIREYKNKHKRLDSPTLRCPRPLHETKHKYDSFKLPKIDIKK